MSQAFARLLEVALAGTSRRAAPPASDLLPAGGAEPSPEARVLRLASYEGLRRLAGRASRAAALPAPVVAAPADHRPEVSQAAARRLDDLLAAHVELLPEWLSLVAASARRVPAASLPALLEHLRTAEGHGLGGILIATGGERLPWLAAQHAPWAAALAAEPASTAARMPPPEHSERWAARTRRVVSFTEDAAGNATLDIALPSVVPADWLSDGLVLQPPRGISGPAWLVQQLVARTPPATWPPTFFPAAQASAWSRPLLVGLGQAAQAYADPTACEVLLLMRARAADPLPLDAPALFSTLPSADAERVLQSLIELGPAAFAGLPDLLPGPWSLAFSRWLVAELPRLAARWQYGLLGLLGVAPMRLDPAVLPAAERLLDPVTNDWSARALLRVIQTLDYRQAMAAELRT